MRYLSFLVAAIFLTAEIAVSQNDTTRNPGGFSEHGAVTGFAAFGPGFYQAIYDSGVFPIFGSALSGQIPGSENVIISFIPANGTLVAGIDALDSTSASQVGTDGGVWQYSGSWSKIGRPGPGTYGSPNKLPSHSVLAVAWDGTYLFVGLPGSDLKSESPSFGGVWRSIPGGSWDSCFSGPMTDSNFVATLYWDGTSLYAGTFSGDVPPHDQRGYGPGGIFKSTDHGTTWSDVSYDLPGRDIKSIMEVDTMLYVATLYNGVFRKGVSSTSWTEVPFPSATNPVSCFAVDRTNLYAGTFCIDSLQAQHGVFLLDKNASTWKPLTVIGLADSTIISALAVYNGMLYVGTGGTFGMHSKYYGTLSLDVSPIAVRSREENVSGFSLGQNYPDPFNPSTVISYQLTVNSDVTLKIYDMLGREVATLVNEKQAAGDHSVRVNASNWASGVYFYRLHAGSLTQTRKMVLVK